MTGPNPESTPTRPTNGGGTVPVREYFEALRAADEKLRQALLVAEKELSSERDRRYAEQDVAREVALAAALLAVKERTAEALSSIEKATEVLADTYKADKAQANEWRGTVNDIIAKMGGAKGLWAAILGLIALGFMVWNSLKK